VAACAVPSYANIAMPRLLPADKCPKCQGPLTRQTSMYGNLYTCEKCDKDDPMKSADSWIKGDLKPPR